MTNCFYLDMDGVVADWARASSQYLGQERIEFVSAGYYHNTKDEWERIKQNQRFYRDLPLMEGVEELVDLARQYRDSLGWELLFLTAVPRNDDMPWAFYDKINWAGKYFPDIPVHFGPHSWEKHLHCRAGDILVDDRKDNCDQWVAAGGISFHVKFNDLVPVISNLEKDFEFRYAQNQSKGISLDIF